MTWKNERKNKEKNYQISIICSPDIYNEIYIFYKYNILSENRINNSTNPSSYTIKFKAFAKKSFSLIYDIFFYIKKLKNEICWWNFWK